MRARAQQELLERSGALSAGTGCSLATDLTALFF
jgi:hypothetical protein